MNTQVHGLTHWRHPCCAAAILVAVMYAFAAPTHASPGSEYGAIAGGATMGIMGLSKMNDQTSRIFTGGARTINGIALTGDSVDGSGTVVSSQTGQNPATGGASLDGAEIISSRNRIPIEVGKGSLIRLSEPASTVFISNSDIADVQIKSPTLIYVFGNAPGETSLYALSTDDRVLFNGIVSVQHNLSGIQNAIREMLPDSRVAVKSLEGSVILSGQVRSAAAAEDAGIMAASFVGGGKVVNRIHILAPTQVNLRVKIAEVSRQIVKQIGFRWDVAVSTDDYLVGFVSGGSTLLRGDNAFLGSVTSGKLDLQTVLDALEDEGLISVLAEPNLTALSGETASFLAGGEFPIPVPQVGGTGDAITIQFKRFGVGLSFTPTILSDDQINLKVSPEVSQLSSAGSISIAGFSVPALTTRRVETTVELGSGQSFAIAGLLQNNTIRDLSKFPGLGDLPILGALFRSDRFTREETELVIIVTPYIVRPVSAPRMALPTDGLIMPNDTDRILKGASYVSHPFTETPVMRDQKGRQLIGPAGFSLN